MLTIPCPWCGERGEAEFRWGGEAIQNRPSDWKAVTEQEWAAYLFEEPDMRGRVYERWVHVHGCREWFHLMRDSVTNEILGTRAMGSEAPDRRG